MTAEYQSNPERRLVGDPVDTLTGAMVNKNFQFRLVGPLELRWHQFYDSSKHNQAFAHGWGHTHEFDRKLQFDVDGMTYSAPVGKRIHFPYLNRDDETFFGYGFRLVRVSDSVYHLHGHAQPSMEFAFSNFNRPASLSRLFDASGEIKFRHNVDGHLEHITDSAGRSISITNDKNGRLLSITLDPMAEGEQPFLIDSFQYDDAGNLTSTRNEDGNGYRFEWDANNRMIRRFGRRGMEFNYIYDEAGRCIDSRGEDDLLGVRVSYEVPGVMTKVVKGDGGEWQYFFDESGNVSQIIDPVGGVEKFVRDESGRLIAEEDANGNQTTIIYDRADAIVAKQDVFGKRKPWPENVNAPDPDAHYVADNPAEYELGRFLKLDRVSLPTKHQRDALPLPANAKALVVTREEAAGLIERQSVVPPPLYAMWWPEPKAGWRFNNFAKLTSQVDEFGRERSWSYDESGNIDTHTDFDGRTWKHEYRKWHFRRSLRNPLGHEHRFDYNTEGEITRFEDAAGNISEYAYNAHNQLTQVRRHGRTRESYERDSCGNLVAKYDGEGKELLRFDIGPGNKPVKRILASGDEHTFIYDDHGRYLEASTQRDRLEFAYDFYGNRIRDRRNGEGIEHQFAGRNQLVETAVLNRFTTTYARDRNSALTILDPCGNQHVFRSLGNGIVSRELANGSSEVAQYDTSGKCLFKHTSYGNDRQWSRAYEWSGEGELLKVIDNERGTVRYKYDSAHRLRSRNIDGRTEYYRFDDSDNLIEQPGLTNVELNEGNRLFRVASRLFKYNNRNHIASRRTSRGEIRYEYDSRDQLVRVIQPNGEMTAQYDALGRRTRKTWNGETTEYFWNSDQLVATVQPDGKLSVYIYTDTLSLVPFLCIEYSSKEAEPTSGQLGYVFCDQIGTPLQVESAQRDTKHRRSPTPFGRDMTFDSGYSFDFAFPGQILDVETGLHYNRFRYYDPGLGRYIQSDPLGIVGGTNLYAYSTNALLYADPRGLTGDKTKGSHKPLDEAGPSAEPNPAEADFGPAPSPAAGPVHARYGDGTPVYKDQRPPRLTTGPDLKAVGAHTRLRIDTVSERIYQAREFDAYGNPVRDIDFTSPTFPNGNTRPDHPPAPHQHRWEVNNPEVGPRSGFRRQKGGEPL